MPARRRKSAAAPKKATASRGSAPQQSTAHATGLFADYRGAIIRPNDPSIAEIIKPKIDPDAVKLTPAPPPKPSAVSTATGSSQSCNPYWSTSRPPAPSTQLSSQSTDRTRVSSWQQPSSSSQPWHPPQQLGLPSLVPKTSRNAEQRRNASGQFARGVVAKPAPALRPRATFLTLPDEILQNIFVLLHSSYQREEPGIPPTSMLRICKRLTPIIRPIWLRVLSVPPVCDKYLAGVLGDKDAAQYAEHVEIMFEQNMYHLQLMVLSRLSRVRKVCIRQYRHGGSYSDEQHAAMANVIENLPLLNDVRFPSYSRAMGLALKDISLKRDLRIDLDWSNWSTWVSSPLPSTLRLVGMPIVSTFTLVSLKRLELSSICFADGERISQLLLDLYRLKRLVRLPLKHVELDLSNDLLDHVRYVETVSGIFNLLCEVMVDQGLESIRVTTTAPIRLPNPPHKVASVRSLAIGKRFALDDPGNLRLIRNLVSAFPNLDRLELDSLHLSRHLYPFPDDAYHALLKADGSKRAIEFPYLEALLGSLVASSVTCVTICDDSQPTRQVRFTRESRDVRYFDNEAWTVE
ncbi:hypothetical protein JCM10908_006352 [Rhodotorula pacifica]|uniref:uncharacterized protein n=1 Tax=Rhodotorula pacifica TaxID=1495444 RepID=UPI00317E0BD1